MTNTEYVLGTGDDEVERLGLQHRVWRPFALNAWQRAGLRPGHRVLDVGSGPGWATFDLAEIAGPSGRVTALDQSERFLNAVSDGARARGLRQIETRLVDLNEAMFAPADFIWCRWVLTFVPEARDLAKRLTAALEPGGSIVVHEYLEYGAWRLLPNPPAFECLVQQIMDSWRTAGGNPDVGALVPAWLEEDGLQIVSIAPLQHIVTPRDFMWKWPASFVRTAVQRLSASGTLEPVVGREVLATFDAMEGTGSGRMATPTVIEIVARRTPAIPQG